MNLRVHVWLVHVYHRLFTEKQQKFVSRSVINKWRILKDSLSPRKKQLKKQGYYIVRNHGRDLLDDTIMVIERNDNFPGIMADYIEFLKYIEYAINNDMLPVIDRKHTPSSMYCPREEWGRVNSWEHFFEQPVGIGLEDIRNYKTVQVWKYDYGEHFLGRVITLGVMNGKPDIMRGEELLYWQKIAHRYLRPAPALKARIKEEKEKLFKGKRVLGVAIREGWAKGFEKGIGKAHPLQPETEQVLRDVQSKLQEWNCDYVFLACQTTETRKLFHDTFGDKLLTIPRVLVDYADLIDTHELLEKKQNIDVIERCESYIVEMYLLAQCDALITGNNSGANAVLLIKDGEFEHILRYDYGLFNMDNSELEELAKKAKNWEKERNRVQ